MPDCKIECSGFQTVREDCIQNACLANNLCYAADPSLSKSVSCADWCCVSRSGTAFFLVLFFTVGLFLLATAYYLFRLFQINVQSGAINPDGTPAAPKVVEVPVESKKGKKKHHSKK